MASDKSGLLELNAYEWTGTNYIVWKFLGGQEMINYPYSIGEFGNSMIALDSNYTESIVSVNLTNLVTAIPTASQATSHWRFYHKL